MISIRKLRKNKEIYKNAILKRGDEFDFENILHMDSKIRQMKTSANDMRAERNTASVLAEIARDQEAADMAAWAQKMLDPGELPLPLEPLATPIADFLLPRAIEEFDFGPQPVKGAMRDPSAAAGQVWGNTITGIAGTIGQVAMTSWQNR